MSKKKRPVGRPVSVWTPERIEEVRGLMNDYIEREEIPIVAEFAYQNKIPRSQLYDTGHFDDELTRMVEKKEANLEKYALMGTINTTMAVFSLKQLGWSDKQEHDVSVTEASQAVRHFLDGKADK